jgi:adenine-specific DNA-methyltransferase
MATGVSRTKWQGKVTNIRSYKDRMSNNISVSLTYDGKKSEDEIIQGTRAIPNLIWSSSESFPLNQLYWGDNLPILRSFLDNAQYRGKVALIYIDPPYSTNSVFQSRNLENVYTDLLVGSHYVEFIRERLVVLRELLSEEGSIYIHLDDNMAFEMKLIMDEIFGKKNFRNFITRKKCSTKNTTKKRYGDSSDYILFYSKTDNYKWNRPYDPWSQERLVKEYPYIDEKTGRRYKRVPIHAPGVRNGETGKEWRGMLPPKGKHWQFTPNKLEELDVKGEIYWSGNGNPRRKVFFDESKGIPQQDIWLNYRDSINQNIKLTGYPTEKNLQLLENIICASSEEGDIVLDAFCGSGTTMQAAYNNNRRWIGIDNQDKAICCVLQRFHMGVDALGDYVKSKKNYELQPYQLLDENCFAPSLSTSCKFDLLVDDENINIAKEIFNVMGV